MIATEQYHYYYCSICICTYLRDVSCPFLLPFVAKSEIYLEILAQDMNFQESKKICKQGFETQCSAPCSKILYLHILFSRGKQSVRTVERTQVNKTLFRASGCS